MQKLINCNEFGNGNSDDIIEYGYLIAIILQIVNIMPANEIWLFEVILF